MPTWARAIIFGVELVGFLILCIYAIIKLYKENCRQYYDKADVLKRLREDLIYFSTNIAIILALFLFTFPSYVFLSYNKLLLVTVFVCLSSSIILFALTKGLIQKIISTILLIMVIVAAIFSGSMITGLFDFENKILVSNQTENEKIELPTMFSGHRVGYTYDSDGNKIYSFYYQNNGEWNFKELNESDVQVIEIKEDTYIEETVTKTEYCKQEKKTSAKDYIYTEESEQCTIYLNPNQMVEIKKAN